MQQNSPAEIENVQGQSEERASDYGIAILIFILRITGSFFVKLLVVPVALFYFLTSRESRAVSNRYLQHLRQCQRSTVATHKALDYRDWWFEYRHILSFAHSMVDRVHSWTLESKLPKYQIDGEELMGSMLGTQSVGGMIFVSHLGNFDLAIARRSLIPNKHFNIVMDTSQTQIYNKYRNQLFHSDQISFIEPDGITPLKAMELVERVRNGEIVIIAADRVSEASEKNSVCVNFLGGLAAFPSGPYILAHLLEVPVFTLFALQKKDRCLIRFEAFQNQIVLSRKNRQEDIARYAQLFASKLEQECLEFPLQWYNFYNFWAPLKMKKS